MSDLEREENRINREKKRADLVYLYFTAVAKLEITEEIIHRSVLSEDENQTYSDIDDSSIDIKILAEVVYLWKMNCPLS